MRTQPFQLEGSSGPSDDEEELEGGESETELPGSEEELAEDEVSPASEEEGLEDVPHPDKAKTAEDASKANIERFMRLTSKKRDWIANYSLCARPWGLKIEKKAR
jgi:hypothetical protein